MHYTLEFVEQTYNKFNLQIFGGRLPKVPFRLSTARTFVGKCAPRNGNIHRQGRHADDDFYLCFSTAHNLSRRQAEDTVIHEMIHLFINMHNLADTSHHGPLYRALMNSINAAHKRNITISYKPTANDGSHTETTENQAAADNGHKNAPTTTRKCMIAVMRDAKGWGFKLLPRTFDGIMRFYNGVRHAVDCFELYFAVVDADFAAYPVSSALKIYRLDREKILSHLITAVPYEISAHEIRPKTQSSL